MVINRRTVEVNNIMAKNKQDIEYIPLKEKNNDKTYINSHVNKINKNKFPNKYR